MPAVRTRDTPSQSLEVITDTIQPPSLAIVSPTPRAISFPFNQTHSSPYSSPTASPFEPDLGRLTLSPSKSTLVRTLSPVSSSETSCTTSSATSMFSTTPSTTSLSTFPASPSSSHKRRKSSLCSDIERRPKKGDEDYIKRPENAFILFRRKCCEDRQAALEEAAALDGPTKKQRQADLSKTISQQWKALSSEERLYWEELAKEKKKEHEQMYPNYVYRPQRTKDRKKKGKRGEEADSETTISFVLPLCPPVAGKNHGRSSSAPTPPPCQTIQVPSVYMPSCPTSPSMVPMINRRASHPDHGSSSSSQFDFAASNTAMPQQQYPPLDVFPGVNAGLYPGLPGNPHPLSIPNDMSMGHCVHQMGSPTSSVSSGSGPASPASSTFSPINGMPTDFPYPVVSCDALGSQMEAGSFCGGSLDNVQLGYLACSWETAGAWGHQGQMLAGDEFDMSAIPPVELGIPACGDEMLPPGTFNIGYNSGPYDPMVMEASQYTTDSQSPDTFEQLFNFESMLAAHHGY